MTRRQIENFIKQNSKTYFTTTYLRHHNCFNFNPKTKDWALKHWLVRLTNSFSELLDEKKIKSRKYAYYQLNVKRMQQTTLKTKNSYSIDVKHTCFNAHYMQLQIIITCTNNQKQFETQCRNYNIIYIPRYVLFKLY